MGRTRILIAATALATVALGFWAPASPASEDPPSEVSPSPVATGLAFPSNMAVAPGGRIFFNEKSTGNIRIIEDGRLLPQPFASLPVVRETETGLLGLALDPNFEAQPFVYAYYSDANDNLNHLVRFRAGGNVASGPPENLLTLLPVVNAYHNGGDLAFGPDGKLYVSVGEIHEQDRAQNVNDLGGKVLRLNSDGSVPADNPFGSSNPVYSLGHRNSFGLCFDPATGDLWETENGPDSYDEINRIQAGKNYGWPVQLGPGGASKYVDPVLSFPTVIVPTGCAFARGSLYFGDYTGHLRRVPAPYEPHPASAVVADFPNGVTDVEPGPNGSLYVSTTDSILSITVPQTGSTDSPPPEPGGGKHPTDNGAPAAIVWGIVILVVIIAGGLVFRRLQRRDAERPR